ncbi:CPBP family intramembrane glutamic endopeptidase [Halobaculum limi]|uniref:CPBP family intramembrane glutamic endopeptidase n=1 Tax=Halobaculum limi TaxID=3031916 RepID=UPI0024071691|nr:CPBP family intramembrane glutamic endopeptidase [Halobaculum sp. YSMS11]
MTTVESSASGGQLSGRLRRFSVLFGVGMIGVLAAAITGVVGAELPEPLASQPTVLVVALVAAQSAVLLAVAVLVGQYTAPRVGFTSRLREWATDPRGTAWAGFRAELRPAATLGSAAGVVLLAVSWAFGPAGSLSGAGATVTDVLRGVPLRFLYGGLTEELLLRWGVMSVIAALLWRVTGSERGNVSAWVAWTAIVASAVLFGVGHLPTAATLYGGLTPAVVGFVVVGNTIGGIAYGWLFWRHSLEAAMVGHMATHVVFVAVSMVLVLS